MFYVSPEGGRYYLGRAFTYGDINYTTAGATHDTFIELGFTQVIPQQRPDDRFYIVSGPDSTGAYNSTPRDLDQLKLNFIMEQKTTARSLLSESDWYVLREAEGGAGVPADFRDYRVSVRTIADARCAEIYAAASVEALEALVKAPALIYATPEAEPTVNPAAMTQWPTPLDLQAVVAESYGLAGDEDASSAY
jgi:hypothetical protein